MTLKADSHLRVPPSGQRPPRHPVQAGGHLRRRRIIDRLKLALPALAAIILGLIMVWPQFKKSAEERFQLGFALLSPGSVQNLSMVNASFNGIDKHNHPYVVTADLASEEAPKSGMVQLDQPKADFQTQSGAGVYVEAHRGFLNQKTQLLDLEGAVNLYHDGGYELHTEKATLDLKASSAKGVVPVWGYGPTGRLDGQGFMILEKGGQIVVTGQSNMTVKGASK